MTLNNKSVLYGIISGLFIMAFWIYINQMKTEANLPISEVLDFTNENQIETKQENINSQTTQPPATIADIPTPISTDISNSQALNQIIDQTSQNILPIATPTPTPTQPVIPPSTKIPVIRKTGQYTDGDYQATSPTPWGDIGINITVSNGRWSKIQYLQIPDSPPSQYAASYLANQAITAQNASIDGVSGATYVSDAFRDDLSQIVQQSKA